MPPLAAAEGCMPWPDPFFSPSLFSPSVSSSAFLSPALSHSQFKREIPTEQPFPSSPAALSPGPSPRHPVASERLLGKTPLPHASQLAGGPAEGRRIPRLLQRPAPPETTSPPPPMQRGARRGPSQAFARDSNGRGTTAGDAGYSPQYSLSPLSAPFRPAAEQGGHAHQTAIVARGNEHLPRRPEGSVESSTLQGAPWGLQEGSSRAAVDLVSLLQQKRRLEEQVRLLQASLLAAHPPSPPASSPQSPSFLVTAARGSSHTVGGGIGASGAAALGLPPQHHLVATAGSLPSSPPPPRPLLSPSSPSYNPAPARRLPHEQAGAQGRPNALWQAEGDDWGVETGNSLYMGAQSYRPTGVQKGKKRGDRKRHGRGGHGKGPLTQHGPLSVSSMGPSDAASTQQEWEEPTWPGYGWQDLSHLPSAVVKCGVSSPAIIRQAREQEDGAGWRGASLPSQGAFEGACFVNTFEDAVLVLKGPE